VGRDSRGRLELLAGTGWLPEPVRTPRQTFLGRRGADAKAATADGAGNAARATEDAEEVNHVRAEAAE